MTRHDTCIVPDLPGLGETEWTRQTDFSFAGQAQTLKQFVDGLGLSAYAILAHDTGGTIARRLFFEPYPALATILAPLGPVLPDQGQIAVRLPGAQGIAQFDAGSGPEAGLTFVTVGNAFQANDLGGFLRNYLPALAPIFGPSLLVAAFAVPLVVHRIMRPLREAARQAEQDVPAEALALVRAVNAALDRLAEGAERQRLFHTNAAHDLRNRSRSCRRGWTPCWTWPGVTSCGVT